jgi:hypothetical protein
MTTNLINTIADAFTGAIDGQTRSYLAAITGLGSNGVIQAYSEALGTVRVIAKTTDELAVGDNIYIRASASEKNAPYSYIGYASSAGGARTQPAVSAKTPIKIPDGNDVTPQGTIGTLQYALDQIRKELRLIKGETTWLIESDTDLRELVTFRSPVDTLEDLPTLGNRFGDLRAVRALNALYLWSTSGWVTPFSTGGAASGSFVTLNAAIALPARTLVVRTVAGLMPADATVGAYAGNVLGFTTDAIGSGDDVLVQLSGPMVFPSAVFGSYRGPLFVGAPGVATAIATGFNFAQIVGVVVASNKLIIGIETPFVL